MATPLIELLQAVLRQGAPIDVASLREQGYEDIDAADMKEAMLAMAETAPVSESVVLTEVADGLEGGEGDLADAVEALQSAREAYEGILEAQGDAAAADIDGLDTDGGDIDIDIDVSGADVDVSVDAGDGDGEVSIDVSGDEDPTIDIEGDGLGDIMVTVDGEDLEFELDDTGDSDDFGTDLGGEDVAPDPGDDYDLDLD